MNLFIPESLILAAAILVIGVPVLIVALGELLERLERRDHPFTAVVRLIRNLTLPAVVFFLAVRLLAGIDASASWSRAAATGAWLLIAWVIVRALRTFFNSGEDHAGIADRIPKLLVRAPAYAIVAMLVFHVVQNVWGVPVGRLATTLGLGSVVAAFALQDTLSGLVSGLLLAADRPFVEGDWIKLSGTEGRVVGINWRSTTIQNRDGDLIVMPNGAVAGETILNHSQPRTASRTVQGIDFAFVNPPNQVKQLLQQTMAETTGIREDPSPTVVVTRIDDPLMGYEVQYWIDNHADKPRIHDDFMTRVWYAAQRVFESPFPSPAFDMYHHDGPQSAADAVVTAEMRRAMLANLSVFSHLSRDHLTALAKDSTYQHFAAGEPLLSHGDKTPGVFVVVDGSVNANIQADDLTLELAEWSNGDFFGEEGLFERPLSSLTANATTDVEVLVISHIAVSRVITSDTRFGNEIDAVAARRKRLRMRVVSQAPLHLDSEELSTARDVAPEAVLAPSPEPSTHQTDSNNEVST